MSKSVMKRLQKRSLKNSTQALKTFLFLSFSENLEKYTKNTEKSQKLSENEAGEAWDPF